MKIFDKKLLKELLPSCVASLLIFGGLVSAGSFTPTPSEPGPSSYTLSDVFNKLTDPDFVYEAHDFPPIAEPDSTFVTLTQIWENIPSFVTLNEGDLDSGILNVGLYPETDLTLIDPDLKPDNIYHGENLFGIDGSYTPISCAEVESLRSGLAGYWPFDNDADDYSGNSNDGTEIDVTLESIDGKIGGAYLFDTGSRIVLPYSSDFDFSGSQALSVSAWVKSFNMADSHIIAGESATTCNCQDQSISLNSYADGRTAFAAHGSGCWNHVDSDPGLIEADTWTNVTGVFDGSTFKIYVNGNLEGTLTASGVDYDFVSGNTLTIGSLTCDGSSYVSDFYGYIDEVAVWTRALDMGEVQEIYNNGEGMTLMAP